MSSQYIFEVLKADLEFIDNDKIMSKKTSADRLKLLPALRHAANSMYIRAPGSKETIIYKPFKDALTKFVWKLIAKMQNRKFRNHNRPLQVWGSHTRSQIKRCECSCAKPFCRCYWTSKNILGLLWTTASTLWTVFHWLCVSKSSLINY